MTPGPAGLDYRLLFEHLPSPYLLMTADFTIVTSNDAYARATMIDPAEVAGKPMFEVFPDNPDDPDADGVGNLRRSLQTVVETGRADVVALQRHRVRQPDGRFVVRYWSPINSPIFDDAGRVTLIVHRVQDVTELVTLREQDRERAAAQVEQMEADLFARARELQEANRQLRDANAALAAVTAELRAQQQAKDRFIATLSHELRNPLASASAALDVLGLDVTGHPAQAVLQRQLTALSRLTGDLLDAARVVTGNLRATRTPLDLRALVHAALDDLPMSLPRPALSLPGEPVLIDGDPVRLGQLLTNLLDNARKHTDDTTDVSVHLRVREGHAELRVRDTGPGFDPALAGTLFDPFTRATTGNGTSSGLGLGLAIVRGIAELHDGDVDAHSDGPGTGAIFTVRIPLTAKTVPPPEKHSASQALRMLLVDDNADLAEMTAIMLRRRGNTVTVATNAGAALAIAGSTTFDVVLCDLALGEEIDGYEIARRLRRSARHRNALLVAVSGFSQDADVERGRAAGFDAHFAKPLDLTELDLLLAQRSGESPRD
ncbi:ATP-binding protein [Amycolatopsis vancoresmycina]|uniref:histidine kinase n=1 Tax=Amycolatopsis vancoresmycina DSM 44592 TaxID=1292037 RepID=R1I418_9PSEU|nr:ATP-binding protein [Amycolatopsis vancoresmycina]EOD70490.1 two-component hybrid sensor and regulator [Amycolatopsis vancoresmycina DSM 44592]